MSKCCRCGFICSPFDNSELGRPSNETLLCVAFVSFMGWAALQAVVALIAQSHAMLGDCAAMVVDALTYGFNLCAERKKNEDAGSNEGMDESGMELSAAVTEDGTANHNAERSKIERHLQRRRRHLHLELVPPVMSVSILLIVTGVILHEAISTLILDAHRSEQEQSQPDLALMLTFSVLNLVLDLVNVMCFARAKHLMGYNTEDTVQKYDAVGTLHDSNEAMPEGGNTSDEHQSEYSIRNSTSEQPTESEDNDEDERVNLNMCSAYTHVFADTLRSVAVIIATIIGQLVESVTPEVADATAAVIVSLIILFSLIPLFRGLLTTWCELQSIAREKLALADNGPNDFEVEIT